MFGKLLKYELKGSAPLMLILSACCLAMGGLAAVVLRLITTNWERMLNDEKLLFLLFPAILFLYAAYFLLILYAGAVQYIQLFRFYGSRFTDRGYLMFTLPVNAHQIFLSSAINTLIWVTTSIVVVFTTVAIAVVFGPDWSGLDITMREFTQELSYAFKDAPVFQLLLALSMVITSGISSVIGGMTAIVIGSVLVKRLKVLVSIGIMVGTSYITGIATAIISGAGTYLTTAYAGTSFEELSNYIVPIVSNIVPLIIIIGGYLLSIHLMKKKLNLS